MKKLKVLAALIIAAFTLAACTVPEVVTQPDGTTITNQVVDPRVTAAIETAAVVNTATAPVNPYFGIVSVVLGLAATVSATWGTIATLLKRKSDRYLAVAVKGVEASGSAEAKSAIETKAADAGVKLEFDAVVQKIVN